MKKIISFIALAMVSMVSFAQMTWNVQAGVNMSNITDSDMDAKVGFQVGVGAEYAFTDMWSIRPSLQFVTKGAKASEDGLDATINPMYLQLPIMAAASFPVGEKMNIVVKAGPYLAYGIGGKAKIEFGGETEKEDVFGDDAFDRFDFGLGVGAALEFGKMFVGVDGMFGLVKVTDSDGSSPKNQTFSLSVGYKF